MAARCFSRERISRVLFSATPEYGYGGHRWHAASSPPSRNIAFAILLVGFLIGLYQAALRGGDLQALAVTAIKYLVVAMIIANWATVFRDVNGSFNTVARFHRVNSSGAGDMFLNWMTQLQQQATTNPSLTFWDMITGDAAGTITVGSCCLLAYVLYALAIIVFCFFYTFFGSVLYVLGPLVLALIPVSGIGQLGKTYAINVMIWNAWGILYAIFGALITAIHFNQVNDVLGNGFLGFLQGVPDSLMLGLVSIFYAFRVALVPFIAKRIISGDVGSTAFALVRAGAVAAGAALAGVSGFAAGASGAGAGPALHVGWGRRARHVHRRWRMASSIATPDCRQLPWRVPALRSCQRDEQQRQSGRALPQAARREFRKPVACELARCRLATGGSGLQLSPAVRDPGHQL